MLKNKKTAKTVFQELKPEFKISDSSDFNFKIRGALQKFSNIQTILVAFMFLNILNITTPFSDYLQTKNFVYITSLKADRIITFKTLNPYVACLMKL